MAGTPFTGDVIVQSQSPGEDTYRFAEWRLSDGQMLEQFSPQRPPGSTELWPRDFVIGTDGRLYLYNGWANPYLSIYDPLSGAWSHRTRDGWSTVGNATYGGIARFGNYVFVTDMANGVDPTSGIIVFDTANNTSEEFATDLTYPTDLTLGLDGKLWVLSGNKANAYDPSTFAPLGSVSLAAANGDIRGIAVDASGDIYATVYESRLVHLAPDGTLVKSMGFSGYFLGDVDISETGMLLVGTRSDGAWRTDTTLTDKTLIETGRWNYFVAFVPEPSAALLAAMALGLVLVRRPRTI